MSTKPPVGIIPKSMHDFHRAEALNDAIGRYLKEATWPPEEWAEELAELSERYAPAKLSLKAGAVNYA